MGAARESPLARRGRRPCARSAPPPRRRRASAQAAARPASTSVARPREGHEFGAERERHLGGVPHRGACRSGNRQRCEISTASPAALASGSFMSVINATVGNPAPFATVPMLGGEFARAFQGRHEGAGAGLHVHDQA